MSHTVACSHLTKTYTQGHVEVNALRSVSLDIEQGAFACLYGPSGSGKSTLLNLIGGLDTPTQGEIRIEGRRIDQMSKSELADMRLYSIGFVFQAYNLIPVLSARENVAFILQLQGLNRAECTQRADALLAEVGLQGLENRRPGDLSGGQQQRVAVARALVSRPKLVLADEPTANLDSQTAESLMDLLRAMNQEHGVSFLFSTHDPLVMEYSRRLIRLHDGAIEEDQYKKETSR